MSFLLYTASYFLSLTATSNGLSLIATSELDYIPLIAVSLEFPNGSLIGDMQCVNITIIDDTIKEEEGTPSSGEGLEEGSAGESVEFFSVRLNVMAGAATAVNNMTYISITDNDGKLISHWLSNL